MPPLHELSSLMFTTGRLMRERVSADIPATSPLHLATLQYVAEKKRPRMREVAHYLRITPPSATSLVATLAKSGYIVRKVDQADRRTVHLEITARGKKALSDGLHQKTESLHKIVSGLSERERGELKSILKKLMRLSTEQK